MAFPPKEGFCFKSVSFCPNQLEFRKKKILKDCHESLVGETDFLPCNHLKNHRIIGKQIRSVGTDFASSF